MQKKQLGQRAASSDQFSESSRSLFSVMNLPPRFMQHSLKANTRDDGEFSMWGESGGRWDKITFEDCNTASWLSSGESQIEHSVEKVIHPSSTSRSVISSSSYSGVQGTFTNLASPEGSLPNCNAHHGIKDPTSSSLPDSHLSGSSMKVGCTEVDIGNSSHNAQYVEDYPTSELGAAKNDNYEQYDTKLNPIGAKSSEKISDYHPIVFSGQIQQIPYQDMQPDLHKTDSADITNRSLTSSMSYPVKELATTKVDLDISASDRCGVSSDNSEMNRLMSFSRGSFNLGLSLGCDEDRSFRKSQEEIRNISNSLNGLHIPPNSTHMTPSVSVAPNSHVEMNFRNTGEGIYNSSDKSKQISNLHESGRGSESSNESYEGLIGAVGGSDMPINKSVFEKKKSGWVGPPPRLGLLGGGESSLNNGTSAWGTPHPPAGSGASSWNGNGSNGGQWNSGARQSDGVSPGQGMSPPKPHGTWAQAAGKGLSPTSSTSTTSDTSNGNTDQGSHNGNGATKVRIEEHISELRIAAAYSDGWGQTTVNQDTSWDLLPSPQASPKEGNGSVWRAPINNGTEIWETNIRNRNKGAGVPAANSGPSQKPWGHTPSTHIGGTWGEEEDTSNMWTGIPSSVGNVNQGHSGMVHNNPPPDNKQWGNNGSQLPNSWDAGSGGPENGNAMWGPSANKPSSLNNWTPGVALKKDMYPSGWQEPSPPANRRQVGTNYDDGTAVWGNPHRQGKVCHWKDMKPITSGGSSTNNLPPSGGPNFMPPGPGIIRLSTPVTGGNKPDMGNPIWGKPPPLSRGASWTEMPLRDSPGTAVWDDPHTPSQVKSMPNTPGTPVGGAWDPGNYWGAKPKSASTWADGQIDTSSWGGLTRPGSKPITKDMIWASKPFRLLTEMGFKKDDVEHALRHSNMNLEDALCELQAISNREINNVMDMDNFGSMGRVKVRHGGVSDELGIVDHSSDPSFGPGNFHGSVGFQGPQMVCGFGGNQGFKPPMKSSGINSNTPSPSPLNNQAIGSQTSSLNMSNSISGLNPALVQKILQQQQPPPPPPAFAPVNIPQNGLGGQSGRINQQNLPSTAQLKHLVQQIQMAVQAGHLNPQILNQPLAPQTLQLLYQLLQQIKVLHQLQQQLMQPQPLGKGNPSLQLNVHIAQTKQRIVNLQNQIAAQQALFLKQQQFPHQSTISSPQPSPNDLFKPSVDPVATLNSDLRELPLKDSPIGQPQSRLPHWKNSSHEKDDAGNNPGANSGGNPSGFGDFSRAPGSMSKPLSSPVLSSSVSSSHSSPNLHQLLTQSDSTWSSLTGAQNDWPEPSSLASANNTSNSIVGSSPTTPTSNSSIKVGTSSGNGSNNISMEDRKDSASTNPCTSSSAQSTYNLTDLVAEFEPGKPWKGTPQKNIEDDPHVTPGSVARSPLSLNTIKDSELFSWSAKSSPNIQNNDTLVSSLTSTLPGSNNCWTFYPPTSQNSSNKQANLKTGWGGTLGPGSDVWEVPTPKTRGPPPGLSAQGKGLGSSWNSSQSGSRQSWGPSSSSGWDKENSSLILKNLTPQIDGSTLKTLCMQHGPLQLFHLLLNHGIALVRYSSREEASKAQSALNNCVLGNTTILADIPSESEVQQYLQLASSSGMGWTSNQSSGSASTSSSGFRSNGSSYPFSGSGGSGSSRMESGTWNPTSSRLWAFPGNSSSSLWSTPTNMSDRNQNSRSFYNSFLSSDLLGTESM